MPELPEVETIRRGLHEGLCGRRITGLRIIHPDVVLGNPAEFADALADRRVVGSDRRGKVMWLCLDDTTALAVHLRMSGQALLVEPDAQEPRHTHLMLDFSDGVRMLYVDPRRFGRLEIIDPSHTEATVLLRNIGPDALDPSLDSASLCAAAAGHGIGIKEFLLDQTHLSGIGNIYAAEILHRVRLDPSTPANRITVGEMQRLLDAAGDVLGKAIAACGTTLADARYQSALGRSGEFARMLRVYDREGEPCRSAGCGGTIRRRVSGGRSTYLCPLCQRTGGTRRSR